VTRWSRGLMAGVDTMVSYAGVDLPRPEGRGGRPRRWSATGQAVHRLWDGHCAVTEADNQTTEVAAADDARNDLGDVASRGGALLDVIAALDTARRLVEGELSGTESGPVQCRPAQVL